MRRNFLRFAKFAAQQNIRLPISRRAFGKQRPDAFERILHPQQRPMRLVADAFHDSLRGTPKAHDQRMLAQARQVLGIRDHSTARGNDRMLHALKLRHHLALILAKPRFAIRSKNLADAFAGHAFDHLVRIDKGEI